MLEYKLTLHQNDLTLTSRIYKDTSSKEAPILSYPTLEFQHRFLLWLLWGGGTVQRMSDTKKFTANRPAQ